MPHPAEKLPGLDPHLPETREWRPTPFIVALVAVHSILLAFVVRAPEAWPWWLLTLLGLHLLMAVPGCTPHSPLYGPKLRRLPPGEHGPGEVALTFDDGPDPEVTPRVLELLAAAGARASFFVIGERAERHPELVSAILAAGHRLENHTQRHRMTFAFNLYPQMLREVSRAQDTLRRLTGRPARYFRCPAGMHNFFVDPVLCRLGLVDVTWTRRAYDTIDGDAPRVLERLIEDLAEGDILLLHDGNAARTPGGAPVVLEVLPGLLQAMSARGLRGVPLLDPATVGGPSSQAGRSTPGGSATTQ